MLRSTDLPPSTSTWLWKDRINQGHKICLRSKTLTAYQKGWKRLKLSPVPYVIFWPVKDSQNCYSTMMSYEEKKLPYPTKKKEKVQDIDINYWSHGSKENIKSKKEFIRGLPFSSEESIVLYVDNLSLPKGNNLRYNTSTNNNINDNKAIRRI